MAAKVYHLRLDDETVLSAYHYVQNFYPDLNRELTPAKAIAIAMRCGMAGLRESKALPTYMSAEHIRRELLKYIPFDIDEESVRRPSIPLGVSSNITPNLAISDDSISDEPDTSELRARLRAQINEHVERVTTVDIKSDVFEPDESDIPDVEFSLDIDRAKMLSEEFLLRAAEEFPDDPYLHTATHTNEMSNNPEPKHRLAVRIAYASLDPDLWGTKHAKSLIGRIQQHLTDTDMETA